MMIRDVRYAKVRRGRALDKGLLLNFDLCLVYLAGGLPRYGLGLHRLIGLSRRYVKIEVD
jgi:hypothetical protein